jgi:hypothetical protein
MLFFELVPAFVTLVAGVVVVWLMMIDRRARANNEPEEPIALPNPASKDSDSRSRLRPSMRA